MFLFTTNNILLHDWKYFSSRKEIRCQGYAISFPSNLNISLQTDYQRNKR